MRPQRITTRGGVTLKSYSELVAMANAEWRPRTNTIAELNQHPLDYYNELNNWGHLTQKWLEPSDPFEYDKYPTIIGIDDHSTKYLEVIGYNQSTNLWAVGYTS